QGGGLKRKEMPQPASDRLRALACKFGWAGRGKVLVLFAFLVLLFLALAVPLAQIPSYPVKFDQAQVLSLARGALTDGLVPVHGILNSLKAYNPPFFVWLYILPMAMTEDPSMQLVLRALVLHAASMVILFLLGERYIGPRAGLAAAAVYAFSPQGLYFGPQALIVSHAVGSPGGIPWRNARVGAAFLLFLVLLVNSYGELAGVARSLKAPLHPQRQVVSWIARDAAAGGKDRVSIRYDFLRDRPEWCWIVPYSLVDRAYKVGAEFDYLLGLHGIENSEKTADGRTTDPSYIVVFREGLRRYEDGAWRYELAKFGPYAVLKVRG
ncbi:MAG: glycosyltransferase family 39 protein, partial [Thermodesulfobacteriota bacterium]